MISPELMLNLPKEEVQLLLHDIYLRWGKERAEKAAANPERALLALLLVIRADVQDVMCVTRLTVERGSFRTAQQQAEEILARVAAQSAATQKE